MMNKQEKIELIEAIAKKIVDDTKADIEAGRIPENWTGLELRALFVRRAQEQSMDHRLGGVRRANYANDLLVNDL